MALEDNTEQSCYLPDDIIDDILIRLPVKDLLRYKCVCTRWCSLISSPGFVSSHLDRTISDPSRHIILVQYKDKSEPPILPNAPIPVKYLPDMDRLIAVGSIHGLVYLVDGDNHKVYGIWIWNPATMKIKKLPIGRYNSGKRVTFGFGWDPKANAYKLAKFVYCHGESFGEVWCSNSDSWREIEVNNKFLHPVNSTTSSADVTVKGGLVSYWIVSNVIDNELAVDGNDLELAVADNELAVDGNDLELAVASFDMSTEVLQITSFPELNVLYDQLKDDFSNRNGVFGINWRENFALVERHTSGIQERYNVWAFDTTEACWTLVFNLGLDAFPLGCLDSSNEKLVLVVDHRLILNDMKTGAIQEIGLAEDCVHQARFFLDSLVSLDGFVACTGD